MPPRSTWKGFLRLSLVSVPVKAYTATAASSEIHLRQLHKECSSPINYKKVCPIHGEVTADEIVSGYEHAKGQYVVISPEELDKVRSEADKAVAIDGFISSDAVDPVYYSGKTYYLLPDGPVGQRPYVLLHKGMVEENRCAIAQVVLFGREQIALLRPFNRLIVMNILHFENQVKEPSAFHDELTTPELSGEEMKLAKMLIKASIVERFELAKYKDTYVEKLTGIIEAKVAGQEIVAAPQAEVPKVINLMEALKKSVAEATRKGVVKKEARRKMAPSAPLRSAEKRKKKSS